MNLHGIDVKPLPGKTTGRGYCFMGGLAVDGIYKADKGSSAGFIALIDTGIFQHFREDLAGLLQQNV